MKPDGKTEVVLTPQKSSKRPTALFLLSLKIGSSGIGKELACVKYTQFKNDSGEETMDHERSSARVFLIYATGGFPVLYG